MYMFVNDNIFSVTLEVTCVLMVVVSSQGLVASGRLRKA